MERLQKFMANCGVSSRREAEKLILAGKVMVNGKVITELGFKVSNHDEVMVNGNVLSVDDKVYFLLYKPRGYVSTVSDDKNRKTVVSLINTDKRIFPVGRLDYDSTGVLLLTNDGELTNILTHPKNEVTKEYVVKIKGFIPVSDIQKLRSGVLIDGVYTDKAKVRLKKYDKKSNTSILIVTIHEGKNHQVKNMFKALGYDVLKLKREQFAFLTLDGLATSEYRALSFKEVKMLYSLKKQ